MQNFLPNKCLIILVFLCNISVLFPACGEDVSESVAIAKNQTNFETNGSTVNDKLVSADGGTGAPMVSVCNCDGYNWIIGDQDGTYLVQDNCKNSMCGGCVLKDYKIVHGTDPYGTGHPSKDYHLYGPAYTVPCFVTVQPATFNLD